MHTFHRLHLCYSGHIPVSQNMGHRAVPLRCHPQWSVCTPYYDSMNSKVHYIFWSKRAGTLLQALNNTRKTPSTFLLRMKAVQARRMIQNSDVQSALSSGTAENMIPTVLPQCTIAASQGGAQTMYARSAQLLRTCTCVNLYKGWCSRRNKYDCSKGVSNDPSTCWWVDGDRFAQMLAKGRIGMHLR